LDIETPGEIARRRRVRNALGTQAIEKAFIPPLQFDVFQPLTRLNTL
jgi:hypothetical protein